MLKLHIDTSCWGDRSRIWERQTAATLLCAVLSCPPIYRHWKIKFIMTHCFLRYWYYAASCHNKIPQTIELELAIIFLQTLSQSDEGFKRYINITTKTIHVCCLSACTCTEFCYKHECEEYVTPSKSRRRYKSIICIMWGVPYMRVSVKHFMILLREQRNSYHLRIMKVEQEHTRLYYFLKRWMGTRNKKIMISLPEWRYSEYEYYFSFINYGYNEFEKINYCNTSMNAWNKWKKRRSSFLTMILLREQRKLYQKPSPTSNESRTRRQHSSCLFPKVLIGYTEQEDDIVMMKKKIQLDRSSSEFAFTYHNTDTSLVCTAHWFVTALKIKIVHVVVHNDAVSHFASLWYTCSV